jgi:hypothetical protein
MSEALPVVKRGRSNPRPVTYPRVCYFRPRVADVDVLDRYGAVTHRRASVVLRR